MLSHFPTLSDFTQHANAPHAWPLNAVNLFPCPSHPTSKLANYSAMASNKLTATILILSLLAHSAFRTEACCCTPCEPPAPVKPEPCPPAPVEPEPSPPTPAVAHCPKDTLKLGVCADLLGVVNVVVGAPASSKCCALLEGLADLEAALCLCTAIKANVLGVNLNVALTLSLLLSCCQKTVPAGFQCA